MNMLRTDRTYKTYNNAMEALRRGCAKLGVDFDSLRYVIAANESGRFAPAVLSINGERIPAISFIHVGITVIG
tara:strand:- start:2186 stop:2404 length:219 start_codon:yes stop_codon:yes gene_type:complete